MNLSGQPCIATVFILQLALPHFVYVTAYGQNTISPPSPGQSYNCNLQMPSFPNVGNLNLIDLYQPKSLNNFAFPRSLEESKQRRTDATTVRENINQLLKKQFRETATSANALAGLEEKDAATANVREQKKEKTLGTLKGLGKELGLKTTRRESTNQQKLLDSLTPLELRQVHWILDQELVVLNALERFSEEQARGVGRGSFFGGFSIPPQEAGFTTGHGSGFGGNKRPVTQADFDSLIELIQTTIEPESWDEVGGPGTIERFEGNLSLVIRQAQEIHDEIAELLRQLRRLQDLQVTIEVRFITTLNGNLFQNMGVGSVSAIKDTSRKPGVQQQTDVASSTLPKKSPKKKKSPTEKKFDAALDEITEIDFAEVTLEDAIESLKKSHNVNFKLDKKALEDAEFDITQRINKKLQGITLRSALRLLLKELNLTYVIEGEVLLITSQEVADKNLSTRVYPVADLVMPILQSGNS